MPELVVIVDAKGVPQKTDYVTYDVTHQMVEEFMLKANEIVALHLSELGKDLTYRIHEEPTDENIRDFAFLARAFGFKLDDKPTSAELQAFFDKALLTPYGQYLATSYIRRMRMAIYSPNNVGHYGLGLTHYCHFTSPIRRYVDLVVHRILFEETEEFEALELIAKECSEQERISSKAENNVVLLKKLRLLNTIHTQEPNREYEAIVTRVKGFGFFFEVLEFMLEGFLHVSQLDQDYFVFDEKKMSLRGIHHGYSYASGDRLFVMLKNIDFITQSTDWYLSFTPKKGKSSKTSRSSRSRKKKSRSSRSSNTTKKKGKSKRKKK